MFQRILYTSRAASDIGIHDVYDIIRLSHNRNSESGLTGGLLFLDGYFIQLLEGAPHAVGQRYRRILTDPRHQDIELRLAESDTEVLFPSDWMALRAIDEIDVRIMGEHRYEAGMPSAKFDGQQVKAFVLASFAEITAAV